MIALNLFLGAAVVAVAAAQTTTASTATTTAVTTASQSMPPSATQYFNIANVNATVKGQWCQGQRNTCRDICDAPGGQGYLSNDCDPATLVWSCVCRNGTAPDVSPYQQTIPFFECQSSYASCIVAANEQRDQEDLCTTQRRSCGTLISSELPGGSGSDNDPTTTTTQTGSSSTGSNPTSTSARPTSSGAAAFVSREVGTGGFLALLLAACELFL